MPHAHFQGFVCFQCGTSAQAFNPPLLYHYLNNKFTTISHWFYEFLETIGSTTYDLGHYQLMLMYMCTYIDVSK